MSGVTIVHSESPVKPECTVTLGANRLGTDGKTAMCRVEIRFELAYFARIGPHDDYVTVESIGYAIEPTFEGDVGDYLQWRLRHWKETGNSPDSGFYVARQSEWLATVPELFRQNARHYVVDGRDGYVEVIACRYHWRKWLWEFGQREDAPSAGPVIGEGEGVD